MKEFVVTLLQRELEEPPPTSGPEKTEGAGVHYATSPEGFLILKSDACPAVSDAWVNQMRMEQGI